MAFQYMQTIGEDGLPYITAVDNRYFYSAQNPVLTSYVKRGSATAFPNNDLINYGLDTESSVASATTSSSTSVSPSEINVAPQNVPLPPNMYQRRVGFDRAYFFTWYRGICRLILIIALMGTWISAATIHRTNVYSATAILGGDGLGMGNLAGQNLNSRYTDFESTRLAMLVIAIAAFIVSIIIFFIRLFGVNHLPMMKRFNIKAYLAGIDLIFFICILVLSIVCSVREGQLTNMTISVNFVDIRNFYNKGAFAATAFFGFLSSILYLFILIAYAVTNKRKRLRKHKQQHGMNSDLAFNKQIQAQIPQIIPQQQTTSYATYETPNQVTKVTKQTKSKKNKNKPDLQVIKEVITTNKKNPNEIRDKRSKYDITETVIRHERHITEEI